MYHVRKLDTKKKLFLGSIFSLLLFVFSYISPNAAWAGYDCPGNVTPPTDGTYTRYCTDGNGDTNDTGRLIKISVARGPRVYPSETLRFFAKVFDYNETCSTNSCLKDVLTTVDLVRNLGTTNYNFGSTPTVTFKLFDPSGDVYTEISSGAGGDWSAHATTSQSVTNNTNPPTFTFSGTEYGTWWIYAVDDSTGDYVWFPLYYSAELDTTPTSFFGYSVPKWISDFYENNIALLEHLQITDGPSKGLFHDSRVEPRITDLGSASGPVKQYLAYEDSMQTGFAMKAIYDLWKLTGDSRLETMMNSVIDNVYTQFQGDFNGSNTDPKLDPGTDGAWVLGNYNDDKVVYAYSKAYGEAPFANSEFWISSSAVGGAWAATGWADLGATNASSGDQDIGQLIGIYYAWKYLNEVDPSNPDIEYLEDTVNAGSALTGGKSSGWTQWTGITASNRGTALLYIIMHKMVGLADYFTGNDKIIDNYLSNSASTGYGSTTTQKLFLGGASNGDMTWDDDAHHIFFNAFALEINGETDQVISDTYNITDLKDAVGQQVEDISRSFQGDSDFFTREDVPFNKLYYRTSEDDFYLNSSTADATISSSYTDLNPWTEFFYGYGVTNSAAATDYNYDALYSIAKRSSYDEDFNFLPVSGLSYEGLFTGTFFLRPPLMVEYKSRYTAGALQQLAYYLRDHEVNAEKNDIDFDNTSLNLLNKEWDTSSGALTFKTWDDGTISLSSENTRSGYIYDVAEEGSGTDKTITVNASGVPSFSATKDKTYTVTDDTNLSVVPSTGTIDVAVSEWTDNSKTWTETSVTHNATSTNTISGLSPLSLYTITVDGSFHSLQMVDGSGNLSFNYTGGFSTKTFNVNLISLVSSSSGSGASSCNNARPTTAPDLFQINPKQNSVDLYFTPVAHNADRYFVSYSTNPNAELYGFEFENNSNGVISVPVNKLKSNTIYYFKVRAGNGCQPGTWSTILPAKTGRGLSPVYKYSVKNNKTTVVKNVLGESIEIISEIANPTATLVAKPTFSPSDMSINMKMISNQSLLEKFKSLFIR